MRMTLPLARPACLVAPVVSGAAALAAGRGSAWRLVPVREDECLRCMRCAPVQRCRAICLAMACWTPDGCVSNAIWFVPPGADNKPNLCLICVSALFLQAGQGRRGSIYSFRALALFGLVFLGRPAPWIGPLGRRQAGGRCPARRPCSQLGGRLPAKSLCVQSGGGRRPARGRCAQPGGRRSAGRSPSGQGSAHPARSTV